MARGEGGQGKGTRPCDAVAGRTLLDPVVATPASPPAYRADRRLPNDSREATQAPQLRGKACATIRMRQRDSRLPVAKRQADGGTVGPSNASRRGRRPACHRTLSDTTVSPPDCPIWVTLSAQTAQWRSCQK